MIPFLDFKRELKHKQETIADIFCAVLFSIALIASIIGLIMSILETDIVMIFWCSISTPATAFVMTLNIVWAVKDYKNYKLVREINKTAFEIMILDVLTHKLIEAVEELEKEETTKATKATTRKKTTRKRK